MMNDWLPQAMQRRSPHCDARPPGVEISLLIIHGISLPKGVFGLDHVERLFLGCLDEAAHPSFVGLRDMRVSAHLLIDRKGTITQFCPFSMRAWHAGVSSFGGRAHCNDFSIGIELEGTDEVPYEDIQYEVLGRACGWLATAFPSIHHITGHADVAPGRKTDPGAALDWQRLRRELGQELGGLVCGGS
jgi:AmpD protein